MEGNLKTMNDKRHKFLIALTIIFIFVVIGINRLIYFSLKDENTSLPESKVGLKPAQLVKSVSKTSVKRSVASQDPRRYGIVVQKEYRLSPGQAEWDNNLKMALGSKRTLDSLSRQNAFEGLNKTPKEFERQLQKINERIKTYEGLAHKDPSDEDVNQKLQALYMLKSTLVTLQDKVVIKTK